MPRLRERFDAGLPLDAGPGMSGRLRVYPALPMGVCCRGHRHSTSNASNAAHSMPGREGCDAHLLSLVPLRRTGPVQTP